MAKRVWISANEIIKRNSEEETYAELHGNGYLARLSQRIREIDAQIKAEDEARRLRKEAREKARERREASRLAQQAEEMEM